MQGESVDGVPHGPPQWPIIEPWLFRFRRDMAMRGLINPIPGHNCYENRALAQRKRNEINHLLYVNPYRSESECRRLEVQCEALEGTIVRLDAPDESKWPCFGCIICLRTHVCTASIDMEDPCLIVPPDVSMSRMVCGFSGRNTDSSISSVGFDQYQHMTWDRGMPLTTTAERDLSLVMTGQGDTQDRIMKAVSAHRPLQRNKEESRSRSDSDDMEVDYGDGGNEGSNSPKAISFPNGIQSTDADEYYHNTCVFLAPRDVDFWRNYYTPFMKIVGKRLQKLCNESESANMEWKANVASIQISTRYSKDALIDRYIANDILQSSRSRSLSETIDETFVQEVKDSVSALIDYFDKQLARVLPIPDADVLKIAHSSARLRKNMLTSIILKLSALARFGSGSMPPTSRKCVLSYVIDLGLNNFELQDALKNKITILAPDCVLNPFRLADIINSEPSTIRIIDRVIRGFSINDAKKSKSPKSIATKTNLPHPDAKLLKNQLDRYNGQVGYVMHVLRSDKVLPTYVRMDSNPRRTV